MARIGNYSSTNQNLENTLKYPKDQQSRELSPRLARLVETDLVEKAIDENYTWNKYNTSTHHHNQSLEQSIDDLDFNNASSI